ncbi:MAG: hypothetical protein V3S30_02340 [Thermoanaerobaculia bacterium]
MAASAEIQQRYLTLFLTTADFGNDSVHLTHDGLLVEIGRGLVRLGKEHDMPKQLADELDLWGREMVKTFLKSEAAETAVGARGDAWLAFFRATLKNRREWRTEQKQILEPRVQDLIDIVNRLAQDLENRSGREVLVIVDDLEKGESSAHKEMHQQLFQEHYETLVQPQLSIIYTLPVYFRALPGSRIPQEQTYAFPAARLYSHLSKMEDRPDLDHELGGYGLMRSFIKRRLAQPQVLPEELFDEILLIGGGLFRETARVIREAANYAPLRDGEAVSADDLAQVFSQIKKEYQPMIRGEAVAVLGAVLGSRTGWVPGVEPFLQSRAVVEYENDDLWLDLRYPLKAYVRSLTEPDG